MLVRTFTNQKLDPIIWPDEARTLAARFGNSLTLAKGTVLGIKTADKKCYAYNDALADGTEVAKLILAYDIKTDANGKVSVISGSDVPMWSETDLAAPVYGKGAFRRGDLIGLDANAIIDLGGRFVSGAGLADNESIIYFP